MPPPYCKQRSLRCTNLLHRQYGSLATTVVATVLHLFEADCCVDLSICRARAYVNLEEVLTRFNTLRIEEVQVQHVRHSHSLISKYGKVIQMIWVLIPELLDVGWPLLGPYGLCRFLVASAAKAEFQLSASDVLTAHSYMTICHADLVAKERTGTDPVIHTIKSDNAAHAVR